MKKITVLLLALTIIVSFSCSNAGKESEKSKKETLSTNACDEFLAHYEKWADKYFKAIEDYMNNPADEEVAERYMELMQQAMEWSTEWVDLAECADDKKYEQRFKEISDEIEDKLKEMNL